VPGRPEPPAAEAPEGPDGSRTVSTIPAATQEDPKAEARAARAEAKAARQAAKAKAAAARAAEKAQQAAARAAQVDKRRAATSPSVQAAPPASGAGSNRPGKTVKQRPPVKERSLDRRKAVAPRARHSDGKAVGHSRAALKPKKTTVQPPAGRPPAVEKHAGRPSPGNGQPKRSK
jgi:hypothetical protein